MHTMQSNVINHVSFNNFDRNICGKHLQLVPVLLCSIAFLLFTTCLQPSCSMGYMTAIETLRIVSAGYDWRKWLLWLCRMEGRGDIFHLYAVQKNRPDLFLHATKNTPHSTTRRQAFTHFCLSRHVLPRVVCIRSAPSRSDSGWCCCVCGFEPGLEPTSSGPAAGTPAGNERDCVHRRSTLGPLVVGHKQKSV